MNNTNYFLRAQSFLLFRTSSNILLFSLTRLSTVLFQGDLPRQCFLASHGTGFGSEHPLHSQAPPLPSPLPISTAKLTTQKRRCITDYLSHRHLYRQLLFAGQSGTKIWGAGKKVAFWPILYQECVACCLLLHFTGSQELEPEILHSSHQFQAGKISTPNGF